MVEHEEHGRIFVTTPEYHIHDRTATQWGWTDRKEYLETRTLWYRIQREGPVIRVAFSPDGQVWTVAGELRTVLPKTVKVGLYVFNTTSTAQSVGFQTYHVGQD